MFVDRLCREVNDKEMSGNSSSSSSGGAPRSAERDETGREYLSSEKWQKMGTTSSFTSRATDYFDQLTRKVTGDLEGEDLIRVLWLSATLFFVVGGYWLLRSLKDPIMSVINGVSSSFIITATLDIYPFLLTVIISL